MLLHAELICPVSCATQAVISDTVGFIQKLPPKLVAAFQATLDDINSATLILHVVDCSHPLAAAQSDAVVKVQAGGAPVHLRCPVYGPLPAARSCSQAPSGRTNGFGCSVVNLFAGAQGDWSRTYTSADCMEQD